MNFSKVITGALAVAGLAWTFSAPANAVVLDLGHPTIASYYSTNVGAQDRGVVFDAITDFSIASAGIRFDPLQGGATGISVDIYEMSLTGGIGTRNLILATAVASVTDTGMAFYDIAIDFDFEAGTRYNVTFSALGQDSWGTGQNNMEFYTFNFPDTPSYQVGGALSVLDGNAGTYFGNTVMPHVRFDGELRPSDVAEPATMALFGLGLAGLGLAARRRKA